MRVRRIGTGSEFLLFQDEKEIGRVNGAAVSFHGFATQEDAAMAARAANHALARRRGEPASVRTEAENVAMLIPPAPDEPADGAWGFKIALLPGEQVEVFALARARIVWRALQGTGISRRMRQFADGLAPV